MHMHMHLEPGGQVRVKEAARASLEVEVPKYVSTQVSMYVLKQASK